MRKPARPHYDAIVDVEPKQRGEVPSFAYVLVKRTYTIQGDRLVLAEPEPLAFDLRDDALVPRLPPASDFWTTKAATDVIIQGSACARGGQPVRTLQVSASVGVTSKRIAVFGRRAVTWNARGRLSIEEPEPFIEMPLTYLNAYGGLDPRVPIPESDIEAYRRLSRMGAMYDHPGAYPRNVIGKGYLVFPEPIVDFEMPNLEDPSDLLTPERMVAGSPELWYRQPLPWCFDWTNGLMYPRLLYADLDAWYPCAELDALPEVQRGFLPASLPELMARTPDISQAYAQEASLGMVFRRPIAGQPLVLTGMHPEEPSIRFPIPLDPLIEIEVEGQREAVKPMLTNLVIRPLERKVYTVHFARTTRLPRAFIPEIHQHIPISTYIAGDAPIAYEAPPTLRERATSRSR
jgi:hypothetical protein